MQPVKSHPRARLTRRGPLASTSSFHIPDFCWNTNSERFSPCRTVFIPIPLTLTQKNVKTALCGRAMITLGTQNAEVAAQVGERSPKASPTAPFWEACRETHRPALAWHRRRRRETAAKGRISGPGLAPGSCDSVRTRRSAHPAGRATPLQEPQPRLLLPSARGTQTLWALWGHLLGPAIGPAAIRSSPRPHAAFRGHPRSCKASTPGRELASRSAGISRNGDAGPKVLDGDGHSSRGGYFILGTTVMRLGG